MACKFFIPINENAESMLSKVRTTMQGQGGQFEGDSNHGNFNVVVFGNTIAGNYQVSGEALHITITDKPMLISCGMIESYLKGQIN